MHEPHVFFSQCRHADSGDTSIRKKLETIVIAIRSSNRNTNGEADKMKNYMKHSHDFFTWLCLTYPETWRTIELVSATGEKVCVVLYCSLLLSVEDVVAP